MLYFAYGSNMNWEQMRDRCPSSRFVGIAVLRDHKLAFTRKSNRRGCGVADVVAKHESKVWGVVYEISDVDLGKLDASEGYRPGGDNNSYERRECSVFHDGEDQRRLTVSAYFAVRQANPPLPDSAYMKLILTGARHWLLPEDYVRELEHIEVGG